MQAKCVDGCSERMALSSFVLGPLILRGQGGQILDDVHRWRMVVDRDPFSTYP